MRRLILPICKRYISGLLTVAIFLSGSCLSVQSYAATNVINIIESGENVNESTPESESQDILFEEVAEDLSSEELMPDAISETITNTGDEENPCVEEELDAVEEIAQVEPFTIFEDLRFAEESEIPHKYLSDFTDDEILTKQIGHGNLYLRDKNEKNNLITVKVEGVNIAFKKGILAHAKATVVYDLGAGHSYNKFSGYLGIDVYQPKGNVKFTVSVSEDKTNWTELCQTEAILGTGDSQYVELDITGKRYLKIYIDDNGGNGNDHSVIANGIVYSDGYNISGQSIIQKPEYYKTRVGERFDSILSGLQNNTLSKDDELRLLQYKLVNSAKYISLTQFLTQEDTEQRNQEFMNWFFNDAHALKLFMEGGTPIDNNYINALDVLATLYADEAIKNSFSDATRLRSSDLLGTRGELYEKMAYAIALTHASDIRIWRDSHTDTDPVKRFKIYKDMYERGLLQDQIFERLEIEELRWVVDTMMYNVEIPWANDYARNHPREGKDENKSFPIVYSPHHHIKYTGDYKYDLPKYRDPAQLDAWDEKYKIKEFKLPYEDGVNLMWHVFEEGAVCGGISKTGTNLANAFGVPASVIGQPGHAAFLVYYLDENGNGCWNIDNDVSGWSKSNKGERMPLDWGNASDKWNSGDRVPYIALAQAALNDFSKYVKAEEILLLADFANTSELKESIYREALKAIPYHLDAWLSLIQLKIDEKASNEEMMSLASQLIDNLYKFPKPMCDLIELIREEMSTRLFYSEYDTNIENQVAQLGIYLNNALRNGASVNKNDYPNADVTKAMANLYLGTGENELATFSFDGKNGGKLVFDSNRRFRYRIQGLECGKWITNRVAEEDGNVYTYALTGAEIGLIHEDTDIIILLEGQNDELKNYHIIDIQKGTLPSNLYAVDTDNRLMGSTENLEYRILGEMSAWIPLTETTRFAGNCEVEVRTRATGFYTASDTKIFTFTENSETSKIRSRISANRLSVAGYSSAQGGDNDAKQAIDGNPNTIWHTNWDASKDQERYIIIDLGGFVNLSGMDYLPRLNGSNGRFRDCSIYVSDGYTDWVKVFSGKNWPNNNEVKQVEFSTIIARYVKIKVDNGYGGFGSAAELDFYEDLTAGAISNNYGMGKEKIDLGFESRWEDITTNDRLLFSNKDSIPEGLWITGLDTRGYAYTGASIKPKVNVYYGKVKLQEKKDYIISYKNNIKAYTLNESDAGFNPKNAPVITITGKGNYKEQEKIYFTIERKNLRDGDVTVDDIPIQISNGKVKKPSIKVRYSKKVLSSKTDYEVNYYDNALCIGETLKSIVDPGTYYVHIKGKGNYTGDTSVPFILGKPEQKNIAGLKINIIKSVPYTGEPIELDENQLTIRDGETILTEGKNYEVTYLGNNTKIGTVKVRITGTDETYLGSKIVTFNITGKQLSTVNVEMDQVFTYSGIAIKPKAQLYTINPSTGEKETLVLGEDYTVSFDKNVKVGTATAVFKGKNAYIGSIKKNFKINPLKIDESNQEERISVEYVEEIEYSKGGAKPVVKVYFKNDIGTMVPLSGKADYTISYSRNKGVTTNDMEASKRPQFSIKLTGNLKGTLIREYVIVPKSLEQVKATVSDKVFSSKPGAFLSAVTLLDNDGKKLQADKDYDSNIIYIKEDSEETLEKTDSLEGVGTIKVVIKAKENGNYIGQTECFYNVTQASISSANVKIKNAKEYEGKHITLTGEDLEVTVKGNDNPLVCGEDYIIDENSYDNNINKGIASLKIKGINNYGGTKNVKYAIGSRGILGILRKWLVR